jgi:hypothetical protein
MKYSAHVNGSGFRGFSAHEFLSVPRQAASNLTTPRNPMTTAPIEDSRIETRFVWARCAAQNARAMRDLIRAFQSDGWATPRNMVAGKRRVVRRKRRSSPAE